MRVPEGGGRCGECGAEWRPDALGTLQARPKRAMSEVRLDPQNSRLIREAQVGDLLRATGVTFKVTRIEDGEVWAVLLWPRSDEDVYVRKAS
jgi:hypothetical protein